MKNYLISVTAFLFLTINYHVIAQISGDKELIIEMNSILNFHSKDGSKIQTDSYCGVVDREEDGAIYQYYWDMIEIQQPEPEEGYFVIDIVCKSDEKCIIINRRNGHRSKDFILYREKPAVRLHEILQILSGNCR